MRWNEIQLGLVDLKITGIEENLFFHKLHFYPPTSISGLTQSIYIGSFQLYNNEDLEEFSKLISTNNVIWKKDNKLLPIARFYDIHDVKALNHFKDKFIEYKKPVSSRDIIIRTYDKNGKFMFKLTLFEVYGIYLNTNTNEVSFKYRKELKEFEE